MRANNRVVENLYETEIDGWTIRIWSGVRETFSPKLVGSVALTLDDLLKKGLEDYKGSENKLIERVANLPGVNAVQFKYGKESCLIYNDWP